jgi:hypothetical protein
MRLFRHPQGITADRRHRNPISEGYLKSSLLYLSARRLPLVTAMRSSHLSIQSNAPKTDCLLRREQATELPQATFSNHPSHFYNTAKSEPSLRQIKMSNSSFLNTPPSLRLRNCLLEKDPDVFCDQARWKAADGTLSFYRSKAVRERVLTDHW